MGKKIRGEEEKKRRKTKTKTKKLSSIYMYMSVNAQSCILLAALLIAQL